MAIPIDKKDTLDIADTIAIQICNAIKQGLNGNDIILARNIIQEELNNWISDCETEQIAGRQEKINDSWEQEI